MSDHSLVLGRPADPRLAAHVDVEGKLTLALDAVARLADADVALVDPDGDARVRELSALGARVTVVAGEAPSLGLPDASVDVVLGAWSAYRGVDPDELAEADRILRPGGRLVVVHDYGRDDVSRLADPDRPELVSWSRRGGPFLGAGFKIRVVHCWWTFESLEAADELLEATFGAPGHDLAATLKRPRLSYNVAIYHRVREPA